MHPIIVKHQNFEDGLQWWNMAFAAGYPDWLIRSSLPPTEEGERWAWTGRKLVPLPKDLYEFWLEAHFRPVSLKTLRDKFHPYSEGHDAEMVQLLLKAGLFVTWPWGYRGADDSPDTIAIVRNPVADEAGPVASPFPDVISDEEWGWPINMNRLIELWQDASERDTAPGGLYDTVQDLLRNKVAWLVAQPVPGPST